MRATFSGGALTYTLEGADAGSFDIDDETGQIKTKSGVTYDYEARESQSYLYSVTVIGELIRVIPAPPLPVTIDITDVNEPPLAPDTPDVSPDSTNPTTTLVGDLDGAGRHGPPAHHQLRRAVPARHRQQLAERSAGRTSHVPRSTTITDLNENALYQVQVRATNDEGNGPYSQPGAGWTGTGNPSNNNPTFEDGAFDDP